VYPLAFLLNLLLWSAACFAALGLVRHHLKAAFKALSHISTPTRAAIVLELLAVPLIVLILMNDLPIRLGARGDLSDIFFRPFDHWSVLYLPLPTIAVVGCLLGIAGVYRQLRTAPRNRPAADDLGRLGALTNLVLGLPFFMAVWIVIAMVFVGWVPEVV
jgi:ribose/xylose/arabinose/galactoside ABC-type transport system permease subunit